MHFLKDYYNNIIKFDLINKFNYKTINFFPKIKKIVLTFNCDTSNVKILIASFLAIEIILNQKTKITIFKNSNLLLKIKKGNLISCKIILKKNLTHFFLLKLINEIFPGLKNFKKFKMKQNNKYIKNISFNLKNSLVFKELEKNYYLFKNLPILKITFITNKLNKSEFKFLFNSLKIFYNL